MIEKGEFIRLSDFVLSMCHFNKYMKIVVDYREMILKEWIMLETPKKKQKKWNVGSNP